VGGSVKLVLKRLPEEVYRTGTAAIKITVSVPATSAT
jgi:hypothetical protein